MELFVKEKNDVKRVFKARPNKLNVVWTNYFSTNRTTEAENR